MARRKQSRLDYEVAAQIMDHLAQLHGGDHVTIDLLRRHISADYGTPSQTTLTHYVRRWHEERSEGHSERIRAMLVPALGRVAEQVYAEVEGIARRQYETERERCAEETRQAQRERDEAKAAQANAEAERDDALARATAAEHDALAQRTRADTAERGLAQSLQEREDVRDRLRSLQQQYELLEERLRRIDAERQRLADELAAAQSQTATLQQTYEREHEARTAAEQRVASLEAHYHDLETTYEQQTERVQDLERRFTEAEQAHQTAMATAEARHADELARLRDQYERREQDLRTWLSERDEQQRLHEAEIRHLTQRNRRLERLYNAARYRMRDSATNPPSDETES